MRLTLNSLWKVLREQLPQLDADRLVARRALKPACLGVRYQLTPYAGYAIGY